jgi:hypothetical protein
MVISPAALRARLHGVIAFPVTPFGADRSLDIAGLRANLQHLLAPSSRRSSDHRSGRPDRPRLTLPV